MSGKRKKNTRYSGNHYKGDIMGIKSRLTKMYRSTTNWMEDHHEALIGLGTGLMVGGVAALYCVIKTEEEHEITNVHLVRNPETDQVSVAYIQKMNGNIEKVERP